MYIQGPVGPVPPPCSAPHSNLFQFTFILNRGLDCEPRLLFTGSRDTFVSFHLRGGRREGEGKLTYFQLLKLLNPSRLRAPILPSFFIPCLKPSSHSRRIVPPLHPYSCSCIPISISERLVKIRGFESSLSLFFFFILYKDCPLFFSDIIFPGTNDRIGEWYFVLFVQF